ncbi:ABC transporter permease [bacterium]|nr:ABC transporter permease [bacterium]
MSVYLIRRLLQASMVVFFMSAIVFSGIYIIGDPVDLLVSNEASPEELARATKALGLNKPFHEQYFVFLKNALRGDLGRSFVFGVSAVTLIIERMPATLELAVVGMIMALVIGIPLGMYAGLKPHKLSSRGIMAGSIFGFSLPHFWQGMMMILIFSVMLGWLPSSGRGDTVTVFGIQWSFLTWDGLRHILLPALNMALFKMSLIIRLTRAGVREAMLQDYVKFARAKGVSGMRIIWVHVFKNILIPIITVSGLEFGHMVAFAVVTETVFSWPGMGRLIIQSIEMLDRPVVVAYLMITVLFIIIVNLVVDVLYSIVDPRVRLQNLKG